MKASLLNDRRDLKAFEAKCDREHKAEFYRIFFVGSSIAAVSYISIGQRRDSFRGKCSERREVLSMLVKHPCLFCSLFPFFLPEDATADYNVKITSRGEHCHTFGV